MPNYVDLLKLFEESTAQQHQKILELPRPLEEIFPEARQDEQPAVSPLRDLLKKNYEHLVTAAFNSR